MNKNPPTIHLAVCWIFQFVVFYIFCMLAGWCCCIYVCMLSLVCTLQIICHCRFLKQLKNVQWRCCWCCIICCDCKTPLMLPYMKHIYDIVYYIDCSVPFLLFINVFLSDICAIFLVHLKCAFNCFRIVV